jgi:hypothetical protein
VDAKETGDVKTNIGTRVDISSIEKGEADISGYINMREYIIIINNRFLTHLFKKEDNYDR